ncbi:hypothetical protein QQF64_019297 [Cirrhinus molitorella]|uniref:Uncharacterized protein n=1 Tax=Cirrhinus molitorella TaxID=172907 RepID=A0ABR3LHH9_9TELE
MSSFDIFTFKSVIFLKAEVNQDTLAPGELPSSVTVARFQAMTQRFWRTFLAQREVGTKNRHCSAATGHRHDNSQSDRKASESRWVICMERKVHLKNTPKTFFQTINGRE